MTNEHARNRKILISLSIFLVAVLSIFISKLSFISAFSLSPLIVAILIGMIFTNVFRINFFTKFEDVNTFFTKNVLRFAIVLYGFRLTMQDIQSVGFQGFSLSFLILISTFILGYFLGVKVLKLDKQLSILISAGSSICGAAAVLATESVLKSKPYKTSIAVATVVIFGTLAMFLFPFLYKINFLDLSSSQIGPFIGATLHEVAHVVGAANMLANDTISNEAVISKMLRVLMLAPFLIVIGFMFVREKGSKTKLVIPWFAIFFIFVAIFNSYDLVNKDIVKGINLFDDILLASSMFVLGLKTDVKNFKDVGARPFVLATILFIWLFIGGYVLTLTLI